jgi:hypothetical protein
MRLGESNIKQTHTRITLDSIQTTMLIQPNKKPGSESSPVSVYSVKTDYQQGHRMQASSVV